MVLESGVPNSGWVPSSFPCSHVATSSLAPVSIVVGAVSPRCTGANAVPGPTPYSAVTWDQYLDDPRDDTNESNAPWLGSPSKVTATNLGFGSTCPLPR